ncbi:MAG: hypothetical protein U0359_15195 [Byssovorax sp.]
MDTEGEAPRSSTVPPATIPADSNVGAARPLTLGGGTTIGKGLDAGGGVLFTAGPA